MPENRLHAPPPRTARRSSSLGARLWLSLAATALAIALLPAAATAATPPPGFFGVTAWDPVSNPEFDKLRGARARTYRLLLRWNDVKPKRTGTYRWGHYDRVFENAAKRGIRIMPVLHDTPRWAAPRATYRPTSAAGKRAFNDFAYQAAKRYGPAGIRWTRAPWSRSRPAPASVRALYWQVWNEPNIADNWQPRPSAAQYASMLKSASSALNRASSSVRVVAAGLPWPARGVNADTYLAQLVRVRGVLAATDAFAVHPYGRMPIHVTRLIDRARATLNSRGARNEPLWVTEFGWATGRYNPNRWTLSPAQQAQHLDETYRWMLANRKSRKLLGAIWFSLRDHVRGPGEDPYWGYNTGLLRAGGSAKPSWSVFARRARGGY